MNRSIPDREHIELKAVIVLWFIALIASGYAPADRLTWFLEVAPVLIAAPLMVWSRQTFPLTPLLTWLAFIHGLILILGAHYTYAHVPLGFWLQDLFDFSRNHYDRIGHFAQGFIPAILAREILLRKTNLVRGKMLFYIITSICLAFSAFYELIEWWAAIAYGADADAFLGTQGDEWDTQWDMFMALIGAVTAQCFLAKWHDRQLSRL
jgi:putative membrane protein